MISLLTATLELSAVQSVNFASSKVLVSAFTVEANTPNEANSQAPKPHPLLSSYEPPPDIGAPKRTGGSGGRYV
ncbi:hypothetical protein JOY44_17155 [Phormidium sp. CLA17]|uniref:hypothetical protein n=1 Tax=Leptolyngbya sp. Cla-17 TaxID=2803751 RepID=UPI00149176C2|nr:hypothetical protein [Leptolyngbya sp. Cla-17]MBM0743321.1 hypothetical protein [Leptolyngbya sp. Cla-17]